MERFIEDLYKYNKNDYNFFDDIESLNDKEKDCYVYAWYTKTLPKKYFYIGKGKRDRYNHIIWEIKSFEKNKRKYKGEKYKILQDNIGISNEFLYTDLTAREAGILEIKCITDYLKDGHPLLNQVVPWQMFKLDEGIEEKWTDIIYEKNTVKFLNYFRL